MPRYQRENSPDWAEVEGAAEREMAEFDVLYNGDVSGAQKLVSELVTDCAFTNRKGEPVDPRADFRRLTHRQWDWLRKQIIKATLDEAIDPEA